MKTTPAMIARIRELASGPASDDCDRAVASDHPDYIILVRNPRSRAIVPVGDDDTAHPFSSEAAARTFAAKSKLCAAWPFQIVECNEL